MRDRAPRLVVTGQVVVAATAEGLETAEAVGIADGMVVAVGTRDEMQAAAAPGARIVRADESAVVPGLHDFHLHLVGMARARHTVDLAPCRDMDAILAAVAGAVAALPPDGWLRGQGWWTKALDRTQLYRLEEVVGGRPALLASHDHHSAWASRAAFRAAGVDEATTDPPGGLFERGTDGTLDGVLRERAADLVAERAPGLSGPALDKALDDVAGELAGWGITAVTDAGDASGENGSGPYAALGESFSLLAAVAERLAGRLRVTLDLPVVSVADAVSLGLHSGDRLTADGRVRVGWAKLYADGALGSRTAALFEPYTCDDDDPAGTDGASVVGGRGDRGILRVTPDELAEYVRRVRQAGIGMAIHAIGDRAAAVALDALARAGAPAEGMLPDRIEHAQLVRAADRRRLAALGVTASLQPIHLPSDRSSAESCWADRLADAYAWRSLADAGALLALGSDAPIETPNPWRGVFAAVRRGAIGDGQPPWRAEEALTPAQALAGYTIGPATAALRPELGHLRPGARADLAILNVDLPTLAEADERLASVGSWLTLVDGTEVFRA